MHPGTLTASESVRPLSSTVVMRRPSRWIFWGTRGSLALLDQALIAASNFIVSILLARWLSPNQYGSYSLAFTIFLLFSLSYQSLLLEPQRIFGPTEHAECQREYLGVLLRIHSFIALIIFVALGVAACLIAVLFRPMGLSGALAGVTFAAPCILLLWLARGAFYVRMSPQHAVTGSAVYCFVFFVGLTLIYKLGLVSPLSAFLVMGIAALMGSAILLIRLKPVFYGDGVELNWKSVFQQHWGYGRWILASSFLSWLTGDIYYPLVTAFSGIPAAGAFKALQNLSLPIAQALTALSLFVLPYACRVRQKNGVPALTTVVWKTVALFATVATGYWTILIFFSRATMDLLYGQRYIGLASLIPLMAGASIPWNIAYAPTIALRAVRSSASILGVYIASSAVAIAIGIPATKRFGLPGALWTSVVSNLAALVVAWILLRRKLRSVSVEIT